VKPNAIAVHAASAVFQSYTSGVITQGSNCGTVVDHAITAVGYGTENGVNYWKIKNSWADSWGESGYIRISKDINQRNGPCGITSAASYPTLA